MYEAARGLRAGAKPDAIRLGRKCIGITQAENAVGDWRLTKCTLYVTKEPCPMCAGAIVHTRLDRVVFGAPDPKGGAAGGALNLLQFPTLNHRCAITSGVSATVLMATKSVAVL